MKKRKRTKFGGKRDEIRQVQRLEPWRDVLIEAFGDTHYDHEPPWESWTDLEGNEVDHPFLKLGGPRS